MDLSSTTPLTDISTLSPMPAANLPGTSGRSTQEVKQQFESVMISMLLKTMRQSMSQDMFAGDSSDTFGGMFDLYLGQHMAEVQGLGLSSLFDKLPTATNSELLAAESNSKLRSTAKPLKAYQDAISLAE